MKLRTKLIAATLFLIPGISHLCQAQKANTNNLVQSSGATTREAIGENGNENNTAGTPAVKTFFLTLFPDATDQQWSHNTTNSFVTFLNNGRKVSTSFSAKGKLIYIITACSMEQLPGGFSKMILNEHPACRLLRAIEIKAYGETAYQAILENASGFITLKYTSDGVEEIQQVKKQHNR